jgi:protein TonB
MYEIIFSRRNKAYGAYAIRSSYGNTVFKSLLFMAMGFVSVFSTAFYLSQRPQMAEANIPPIDSTIVIPYIMNPPEPKPPTSPRTNPPRNSSSAASGISTQIDTTAADTKSAEIAVNTGSSTSADPGPQGPETDGSVTGPGTATTQGTAEPEKPVIFADTPPEFEGGLKALYQFLSSHLQYPPPAMEAGREGTAYVKFVVDENGKVGTLSLQNNLGYGLDEEALRVVGMIPKFKKPGILNGKPVKVYYQVPIRFTFR